MMFRNPRSGKSTRQLMGVDSITSHGVKTPYGELAYFILTPDNLSILSPEGVRGRVKAMTDLLKASPEARLIALDSRESYRQNQNWYRDRLDHESVPAVADMLQKDIAHLDTIQAGAASSREFLLAYQLDKTRDDVSTLEQRIRDCGFTGRVAVRNDIKRILAVYYRSSGYTEEYQDYDGQPWLSAPAKPKVKKKSQKKKKSRKKGWEIVRRAPRKDFLDLIAPGVVQFSTDHYIMGDTYRCVMAVNGYPTSTEELALLRHLGDQSGVTLSIYTRRLPPAEENAVFQNAASKNRLDLGNTENLKQSVTADSNLRDMARVIESREPLIHCAVFIELIASNMEELKQLKDKVLAGLGRDKISVDQLLLRQREGFLSVQPAGRNAFNSQYERVLPVPSVANLYPNNYSGKSDPNGFYIGRDKYGSNIIVDLDRRAEDKTNSNVLILGNSGQGKSYLLKLLTCNILESGKNIICLDPEHEMRDLAEEMGGCFIDLMGGEYRINPLEPKVWDTGDEYDDRDPVAFRQRSRLSQHISFLKDFFRCYKEFSDRHIDVIEILLERLYSLYDMNDQTDFASMSHDDFPTLSDLYDVAEDAYDRYDAEEKPLYTRALLQEVVLGLRSICKGTDSKFFDGHTNITSSRFLVFGVKGLMDTKGGVRNALLFNTLSYISDRLLTEGHTAAVLDELYLFLSIPIAIEYIRGFMKRVRKKDSSVLLASQNLEDFTQPGLAELTRPLFSIPTHQFIFNGGAVDRQFYMDNLQLTASEFELIRFPQQGVCLYKCGNERYQLVVKAPKYKSDLFGKGGGK